MNYRELTNKELLKEIIGETEDHVPQEEAVIEMNERGFDNLLSFSSYTEQNENGFGVFESHEKLTEFEQLKKNKKEEGDIYGGDLKRGV